MGIGAGAAAGIAAAGSVAGSAISASAAGSASKSQQAATKYSAGLLDSAGTDANKYLDPYLNTGSGAYNALNDASGTYGAINQDYTNQAQSLLGGATDAGYGAVGRINQLSGQTLDSPNATFSSPNISFSDPNSSFTYGQFAGAPTQAQIEATPGYQFNLTQGQESVQNSAAARGLSSSGAALKGAASYASGLADSTYQNQYLDALSQYQTNEGAQQSIANQDFGNALAGNQASFTNALEGNQANFTDQQQQFQTNMTAGLQQAQGYTTAGLGLSNDAASALGINTASQGNIQGAFNRQNALAQYGYGAAQQEGGNLLASAGGQANYAAQGGNAAAAGSVGIGNALSSGLTGLGNTASQYALYNSLLGGGNGLATGVTDSLGI